MRFARALVVVAVLSCSALATDYHVAVDGNDGSAGLAAAPFKTIARASQLLKPGDRCIIHAGTYREVIKLANSGQVNRPIVYTCNPGDAVTISGTELVAGPWQSNGQIRSATAAGPVEQVFCNGVMLNEARWPNAKPMQLMDYPRAKAGEGTGYDELCDKSLPPGNLTGAVVLIWNGERWWSSTRRVASYTPGQKLTFDKTFKPTKPDQFFTYDPYAPKAGNPYVIYGARDLLDAPGEWFYDSAVGKLELIPPEGVADLSNVEVRRRAIGLDLSGRSAIHVSGLSFFAAGPNLTDSVGCTVQDCSFRFVEHCRELAGASTSSVTVTGKDNEFRRCSFGYSAGPGLRVKGENNRLIDCIVFDTDYIGAVDGAISAGGSVGAMISYCTILRTGRDGIQHGESKRITITHNDIYNVDLIDSDAGGIYSWGTDGTGSLIAYNHVHDNRGEMNVGIYIDNFCKGFTVHHNLSWNNTGAGITLNSDAENHLVANNTLVRNGKTFATFAYVGKTLTQKGTRVINNLVTGRMDTKDPYTFAQGDFAPELKNNARGAIDEHGVPVAGSAAIGAGIIVPGITGAVTGKAPDIGAYERGGEIWTAGATWKCLDQPAGIRTSIAYAPLSVATEKTMIRDGLFTWLDAADASTIQTGDKGQITLWRDRSGTGHDAVPTDPAQSVVVEHNGINGIPTPTGKDGSLKITGASPGMGGVTVIAVAQCPQEPKQWQRLAASWDGKEKDWIAPNWQLMIPDAEKPHTFAPRVFILQSAEPRTLQNLTIFGTAMGAYHNFSGQIAEVLVYSRALSDEEQDAIAEYLTRKWGIAEPAPK